MSLPPPSSDLLERLRRDKHLLAEHVVEDMRADPFWNERFEARGRTHAIQDLVFHIDYLIQAIEGNDLGIIDRYARWLQGLLTTRGMSSLHIADSFGRLAGAIGDATARRYLVAARTSLLYEAGSARNVQERIRDVVTSGQPGPIEDTAYYFAYLADAIALGQPNVFFDHIVWLAAYLKKNGRDPHTIASTLEGLSRTLDVDAAKGLVSTALREIVA